MPVKQVRIIIDISLNDMIQLLLVAVNMQRSHKREEKRAKYQNRTTVAKT